MRWAKAMPSLKGAEAEYKLLKDEFKRWGLIEPTMRSRTFPQPDLESFLSERVS
jgi:hypothetical protein